MSTQLSSLTMPSAPFESVPQRAGRLFELLQRSLGDNRMRGAGRLLAEFLVIKGSDFTFKGLCASIPRGEQALSVEEVIESLANLGFYARKPSRKQPAETRLPAFFVPDAGQPCLIARGAEPGTLIRVDMHGQREVLDPRARLRGDFFTLEFDSARHHLSKTRRSHTEYSWFRALLSMFSGIALALLIVSIGIAVMSIMVPVFTIQMFTQVIGLGALGPLPMFTLGMVIVVLGELFLLSRRSRMQAFLANRLDYLASTASFRRLIGVKPAISDRIAITDQAARLRSFESVREFITGPIFASLLDLPVSLIAIATIALLGKWLALVPVITVVLQLGLFAFLLRFCRILTNVNADESTAMQRAGIETLEKRQVLQETGMSYLWPNRLIKAARREQKARLMLRILAGVGESASSFLFTAGVMMILAYGAVLTWNGQMPAAALLAAVILGFRAIAPFHVMCMSVQRVEQLRKSVGQFSKLMELPVEEEEHHDYSHLKSIDGQVSFVNSGIRVNDTRPVFVGFDLEIEPGDVIGITGANGSGKTSVLRAIQGTQEVSLGTVRVDGVDIRQLPLDELRSRIGYVPQSPRLFAGTLRENLLFMDPLATNERIASIIKIVGLGAQIADLPGGLDFVIDTEAEVELSTEFQFRFAFAQALLTDSKLLLIDEIPNSLLTGHVGELLKKLISTVKGQRTVVFVSHRTDFLSLADRVVLMRYGKVPRVISAGEIGERAA